MTNDQLSMIQKKNRLLFFFFW